LPGSYVVLGVSGGIAAYKAVEVCRRLVDAGHHVAPVLTADALRFVGEVTFSALASEPVRTSLFPGGPGVSPDMAAPEPIPHTRLGQAADLVVVAPATAKIIGKYAAGISDDLLTATLLATRAPVLLAPAMHTEMWEHAAVQENLAVLRRRGVHIVGPESGRLAGGDVGEGRLAEPERIVAAAVELLTATRDLAGVRVLVTAGGTREPLDPVRYIGNRSSGKMGYALAQSAAARGASVTLVTTVERLVGSAVEVVRVETAAEMADAVLSRYPDLDVVVMAAAVADFRPKVSAPEKLKKAEGPPDVVLEPTVDILGALGASKAKQYLVGFAAETVSSGDTPYPGDLVSRAAAKLAAKRVDLMVANDVTLGGSGFGTDTNQAVLLTPEGAAEELPNMSKAELAGVIWDRVAAALWKEST
jgi:phosphopantothenoylcysteine decarboxylase/phosphopantothenate--cysteine ligase